MPGARQRRQRLIFSLYQLGAFEQPAEILLAGAMDGALFARGVGKGFVAHLKALQLHDAEIRVALFP